MMEKATVLGYMKDQPRALQAAFKDHEVYTVPFVNKLADKKVKKILFFGSGTSYNAAVVASYYFKHIVGIDARAEYPTVFENYEKADWTYTLENDEILFVGISQSGTSISTVNVMKYAKEQGYQTIALTEALDSEITKHVDTVIDLLCGKELTPPETRGYTVTLLTLYMWAIATAHSWGVYDDETYKHALAEVDDFTANFQSVIEESEAWYEANKTTIVNSDRIFVLGYGVDFGSALEGMLKIGEMLRIPTIGYEMEEFVHGPTMGLTDKQTIIMFGSDDKEYERMLHFREVFKKYTPRVHLITCQDTQTDARDVKFTYKANKYLAPIAYTVPCQFVAAKGAKDIGIDTCVNPFKDPLAHFE